MSFAALAWASKATPGSAPRKLVLLALSDRHNTEDGLAWPSIKWLVEWTDLNRKTIITALQDLEAAGFIADSGVRKGATMQVKAYRLNLETVPKAEQSQKRNSSEKSQEQSHKRDTDTVRNRVSEAKASKTKSDEWHSLPVDWAPTRAFSANTQSCVDSWPPGALESELESFGAWAANAPPVKGKGLKKDWDDAFGNWIRREHRDRYSRQQQRHQPDIRPRSRLLDALNATDAELARSPAYEDHAGAWTALPSARAG